MPIFMCSKNSFDFQIDVGKSGCLDFGDLASGGAKSLPLKLLNRTRATVPVRLVISAVSGHWCSDLQSTRLLSLCVV